MELTITLYNLAFWATIFFTVLGSVLGLIGVWIKDFWDNDVAWRLILTDMIFAGTSLIVAVITRWLG